ncbi:MAG: ABC transporter ATP-binding protein, partial [Acidobacteriota bacterium]
SGGLRQRMMIAMALVCRPKLLIADEPTTAVDVTVQAQILELLRELKRKYELSLLLISHDLSVVGTMADRVAVMYAGRIIEVGPTVEVLSRPQHPYTAGLLRSLPELKGPRRERLETLSGVVPNLADLPPGCRFEPRCPVRVPECTAEVPPLQEVSPGHWVSCIRAPF